MNPLILHLKYKYYEMYRSGEKNTEYRERKPYWDSRIHGQTEAILAPGYFNSNDMNLKFKIKKISTITYSELPRYAQLEFVNSKYHRFYAIEFEVNT